MPKKKPILSNECPDDFLTEAHRELIRQDQAKLETEHPQRVLKWGQELRAALDKISPLAWLEDKEPPADFAWKMEFWEILENLERAEKWGDVEVGKDLLWLAKAMVSGPPPDLLNWMIENGIKAEAFKRAWVTGEFNQLIETPWNERLTNVWNSIELKPGWCGFSIDLKSFFGRKKHPR